MKTSLGTIVMKPAKGKKVKTYASSNLAKLLFVENINVGSKDIDTSLESYLQKTCSERLASTTVKVLRAAHGYVSDIAAHELEAVFSFGTTYTSCKKAELIRAYKIDIVREFLTDANMSRLSGLYTYLQLDKWRGGEQMMSDAVAHKMYNAIGQHPYAKSQLHDLTSLSSEYNKAIAGEVESKAKDCKPDHHEELDDDDMLDEEDNHEERPPLRMSLEVGDKLASYVHLLDAQSYMRGRANIDAELGEMLSQCDHVPDAFELIAKSDLFTMLLDLWPQDITFGFDMSNERDVEKAVFLISTPVGTFNIGHNDVSFTTHIGRDTMTMSKKVNTLIEGLNHALYAFNSLDSDALHKLLKKAGFELGDMEYVVDGDVYAVGESYLNPCAFYNKGGIASMRMGGTELTPLQLLLGSRGRLRGCTLTVSDDRQSQELVIRDNDNNDKLVYNMVPTRLTAVSHVYAMTADSAQQFLEVYEGIVHGGGLNTHGSSYHKMVQMGFSVDFIPNAQLLSLTMVYPNGLECVIYIFR